MTPAHTDEDGDDRAAGEDDLPDPERIVPPGASVSLLAVRASDGESLVSFDADRAVAPASNTKLVTAALALDRLGPGHRFETALVSGGPVREGVLDGDLVFVGSGSPDVDQSDLATLAGDVAERVDCVTGDLVVDTTAFSGPYRGPGRVWTDEHHSYGALSSAVALSGNLVTVTVDAIGADVSTSVDRDTDAVDVDVSVTADRRSSEGTGDEEREPGEDVWTEVDDGTVTVGGTVRPETSYDCQVPVYEPVRHCGLVARETLASSGVEIGGRVRIVDGRTAPAEEQPTLAAVESAPVRELVRDMNVVSDNFIAEQLARAVAAAECGEGSWKTWEALVAEQFTEFGVEAVRICDGSGLSRYNRVSARGVVALLSWATTQSWSEAFFESLPGPGEGTLESRLDDVPVAAKTGTLTGARALSGRLECGDDLLFSILVGDVTVEDDDVRDRQDEFLQGLRFR